MAQNLKIANALYEDVPSISIPTQNGGEASFVDTSDADAMAEDILEGKSAYVGGAKVIGTGTGNYLPLSGGTLTGPVVAPSFQTGTDASHYFQCRKFRGEGNADTYYHAIEFGYAGHNRVDFYEYGGIWNFYKSTDSGKAGSSVLVGAIKQSGWNGNVVGNVTGNASTATKATQDASGNVITDTYAKKTEVTVKGVKVDGATSPLVPDSSGVVTIPNTDLSNYATKSSLSSYQTKLTFDSTPTANSSNPVTSDGIKKALDSKLDTKGGTVIGIVNLEYGLTSTGTIQVNPNATYYNEGIRLNESTAKWATIYMGAPLNSAFGANENAWGISRRPDGELDFFKNGSGSTLSTGLRLNGDGTALLGGKEVVKNTGTWNISITGNADTATKATQDGSGNVIADTYTTKAYVDTAITNAISAITDGDSKSY